MDDDIKMALNGNGGINCFSLSWDRGRWWAVGNAVMWEFLDYLRICWLLGKGYAPWS